MTQYIRVIPRDLFNEADRLAQRFQVNRLDDEGADLGEFDHFPTLAEAIAKAETFNR